MGVAENLPDDQGHDKVTEKRMGELVGCTAKALQRRREKGLIPQLGVDEDQRQDHVQQKEI